MVEIQNGPAGMMLIKRTVLKKMIKDYPDREIKYHPNTDTFPKDIRIYKSSRSKKRSNILQLPKTVYYEQLSIKGFIVCMKIFANLITNS